MAKEKDINLEIRECQQDLINLRQAFIELAERRTKRRVKAKLKFLDEFQPEVQAAEVPQFSTDVKEVGETDISRVKDILKKEIKLYQIFINKINCPVSQIIDAI